MAHCDDVVTREAPLQKALGHMREARLQFLPVVERKGVKKLVGFLDRRAIDRFLSTELLRRREAAGA
jgi:CBS domain-containing protein